MTTEMKAMKTKEKEWLMRRLVPAVMGFFGVFAFASALEHSYRAFQICPPGWGQQFALGQVFLSGLGLVFAMGLTLVFAGLTIFGVLHDREPER